jgi:hypothetical protein
MSEREADKLIKILQDSVDDPMWPDHVEMPKRILRIVIERLSNPAQGVGMHGTLTLIKKLAWYYDINDCVDMGMDDTLEVPVLDLKNAHEICVALGIEPEPYAHRRSASDA